MSAASRNPGRLALKDGRGQCSYDELANLLQRVRSGLVEAGVKRYSRVAVFLPKSLEAVVSFFATAAGGGIFVPINPLLKPHQVGYILRDSGAELLVTSEDRLESLASETGNCADLHTVVTVELAPDPGLAPGKTLIGWGDISGCNDCNPPRSLDEDPVAIFYTSGSTGRPKGVVLSHRNMVVGAQSVSAYLQNTGDDRLLAALPFSFDYGFSQLTTAFYVGASVVLLNYLLPADVLKAVEREHITGLAGVPPLWIQLAAMQWAPEATATLRYITNSGGKLPVATVKRLRNLLPTTDIYLMYGLTEAFRSTYLPPEEVDKRPTSIGKAIPNAEVLVVRPDGTECQADEPGELVHRGALVAKGYWRDPERTRERFRPAPATLPGLPLEEIAVWSGDIVRKDAEGYLYFVGRNDEMIKTSGYRVSPTEVEEGLYATQLVSAAVAFGVEHPTLGQSIVAVVEPADATHQDTDQLLDRCREHLPSFMMPARVIWEPQLPRNSNGKLDRATIIGRFRDEVEKPGP